MLLPADPALPTLPAALDPNRVAAALDAALTARPGAVTRVRDCRLERFRYRKAERAILLYRLRLAEANGERPSFLAGHLYPGEKARALGRKHEAKAAPSARSWDGGYLPEMRLFAQLFPQDRRLPGLAPLVDRLLHRPEEVLADAAVGNAAPSEILPVRWRPGLCATLRLSWPGTQHRLYAKVYPDAAASGAAFAEHRAFAGALRATGGPLDAAAPCAHLPDFGAVLIEEVPGRPLDALVADGGPAAVDAGGQVARALVHLHRAPVRLAGRRTAAQTVRAAEHGGRLLAWAVPALERRIGRLLRDVAEGLEEGFALPTHLDLKPDHLLLHEGRITVVDLDSAALSDPVADGAKLFARLQDAERSARRATAAAAFLDAYRAAMPESWAARLPAHYACALLGLAVRALQHAEPDWPRRVANLLGRAERALAGEKDELLAGFEDGG